MLGLIHESVYQHATHDHRNSSLEYQCAIHRTLVAAIDALSLVRVRHGVAGLDVRLP